MKKAFYIICLFFISTLFAEEFCNGEFWYEINKNDEVIIFEYMSKKGFVQIPSEIDGKKVKGIRNTTFERTNFISSVTIPDSVELIESGVFMRCNALIGVTVSDRNENFEIVDDVLYNKKEKSVVSCFSTKENIVISYGIEKIGNKAFAYCDSLVSLTIPDTVVEIGDEAFVFCKAISVINIPNFINKIGAFAFNHCKSLKTLTMPNTVNVIGDGVFAGCSLLKNVDFSEDNENFVIIDNPRNQPWKSAKNRMKDITGKDAPNLLVDQEIINILSAYIKLCKERNNTNHSGGENQDINRIKTMLDEFIANYRDLIVRETSCDFMENEVINDVVQI